MTPIGIPLIIQDQRPQGGQGIAGGQIPAHAGAFLSLDHDLIIDLLHLAAADILPVTPPGMIIGNERFPPLQIADQLLPYPPDCI
jgi:hypothetical protein